MQYLKATYNVILKEFTISTLLGFCVGILLGYLAFLSLWLGV